MQEPEAFLIHLLTTKRQLDDEVLSPLFLANLYTNSALLGTVSSYILEQHWLEEKQNLESKIITDYSLFLTNLILLEIPAMGFLEGYLQRESLKGLKQIIKTSKAIEKSILSRILCSTGPQKKSFLTRSLEEMTIHFLLEEKFQKNREQSDGHRGPCLYRTFDGLDDIFELNYKLDQEMVVQKVAKERLYERAGIGVQSGYSTILLALHAMKANAGDKVIDLGSGYG
ncbi:MAG: hypothetical protein NXH75_01625, partial [Halobacteriovoraceae bacterium]|nr:hypothetical protein [Halobacteriovoraceae bacterium]